MATGKDHQVKPLISITDGKKLGEVKDHCLAGDLSEVRSVLAGTEGLI